MLFNDQANESPLKRQIPSSSEANIDCVPSGSPPNLPLSFDFKDDYSLSSSSPLNPPYAPAENSAIDYIPSGSPSTFPLSFDFQNGTEPSLSSSPLNPDYTSTVIGAIDYIPSGSPSTLPLSFDFQACQECSLSNSPLNSPPLSSTANSAIDYVSLCSPPTLCPTFDVGDEVVDYIPSSSPLSLCSPPTLCPTFDVSNEVVDYVPSSSPLSQLLSSNSPTDDVIMSSLPVVLSTEGATVSTFPRGEGSNRSLRQTPSTRSNTSSDSSIVSPNSSSSSVLFNDQVVHNDLREATCLRIRKNASLFLAGVLKSIAKCVICSIRRIVNLIDDHDVKRALRATDELRFLTKNCLINVVQLAATSDEDEI